MKLVKLTGKSTGLAKHLIEHLSLKGYTAVGYGRGDIDLEDARQVSDIVKDSDVFINNANHKFTQTEILFELFDCWKDNPNKHIINISSRAAQPNISKGYLYAAQKAALEHLANNLIFNSDKQCRITTVSLGYMRNNIEYALPYDCAARAIINLIEQPRDNEIAYMLLQNVSNYKKVQNEKFRRS